MTTTRNPAAPGMLVTIQAVVSRPDGQWEGDLGQEGKATCLAMLTFAQALGRADAVRDQAGKEAANDNDARGDLRTL